MKLISLLLVASAIGASAATEEQLNKRFAVEPGGRLIVDVEFGAIAINTNGTGEVVVDVWRKVSRKDQDAERAYLSQTPVEFIQDGSTVTIRSRSKSTLSKINWFGHFRNEAKYTITVPQKFALDLGTSGGSISAKNVIGETKARTSGGSLEFSNLSGPVRGETSGGSIQADVCQGALWVHTSGGAIRVNGGSGSLDGETSGGSISVKGFAGPAHIETSGGGLSLEKISGDIAGSTSGGSIHATLIAPLPGAVKLETSGGGITVRVAETAAFELDASTSGGGVSTELPVTITGEKKHNQLRGPVNGGGKTVFLRTSGGGISVKKD